MYRTPMRRGFSPDSPREYRDSPVSPPHNDRGTARRSWSRSRSRSRSSDRTQHSPNRRGRSPARRRSPSRNRSRSRHGNRSRSRHRSKSRPRSKSRTRSRLSPSPYSQRSGDGYSYNGRDQRRYSPTYHTRSPRGSRSPDSRSSRDRSDGGKDWRSGDSRAPEPLPMPKKSILKKRTEVEATSQGQTSQVDSYSSLGSMKPSSSLLTSGSTPGDRSASSIPPSMVRSSGSPLVSGISPSAAAALGRGLPRTDELNRNPAASSYSSSTSYQNSGKNPHLGDSFRSHDRASSEMSKSQPIPIRELKPRSLAEIEEEERFLYGDEDDKTPEPTKVVPPKVTPPPNVPKKNPDEKEFAKIHDLLKTIGLDIGVAEIGKLAVRTQERLHGKKVIPKILPTSSEQPQNTSASSPQESKATSELAAKEQREKAAIGAAAKAEGPAKIQTIENLSPVAQQSGPTVKEMTPPVMQKTAPKEQNQPTSKAEMVGQAISTVQTSSVSSAHVVSTVQAITTVQSPSIAPVPEMTLPPISPSQMPLYPPYGNAPMVPNYGIPPPTYNPYAPYPPYPPSNWTMYPMPSVHQPPPTLIHPPITTTHVATPPPSSLNLRSNLRIIETNADLTEAAVKQDIKPAAKSDKPSPSTTTNLLARHEAERRNKEAEKQKVLDELEGLKKEVEAKTLSLENLSNKVEQLRIQHGILQRKKRREKDGHKDPLLEELTNVLDSARRQISSLTKEIADTKQKKLQLMKVAEILGVSPMDLADKKETSKEADKNLASLGLSRDSESKVKSSDKENDLKSRRGSKERSDSKSSRDFSPEIDNKSTSKSDRRSGDASPSERSPYLSTKSEDDVKLKRSPKLSSDKDNSACSSPCSSKSEETSKSGDKSRSKSPRSSAIEVSPKKEEAPPFEFGDIFEYYDSGGHWCEDCNAICMTLPEYLLHFHESKHIESLKQPRRPWVKTKPPEISSTPQKRKVNVPLKGAEFMVPTKGYYCSLCDQSFADHIEADEHIRTYAHNNNFKKYTDENIKYEVSRRERKKACLTEAQAQRKQLDQKRKLQLEELIRSKKSKKDHEESKSKSRRSSSPAKSAAKRKSKTPDKESVKSSTFGKFTWKPSEDKNQTANNTQKVEGASAKEKEEEAKAHPLKPKGIEIKLLGKPSNSQSSTCTSSSSSSSSTTTSSTSTTVSSSTPSSSTTPVSPSTPSGPFMPVSTLTTASIAASLAANMPSTLVSNTRFKVRPNLPIPLALLKKSSMTLSKPAPLNTFLSIKSADATSKSLPVVKSTVHVVLPEEIVSKAFDGEEVSLKGSAETKPQSKPQPAPTTNENVNINLVPIPPPPPKPTPMPPTQNKSGMYDMLFNKVDSKDKGVKGKPGQDSKAASSTKSASAASSTNPASAAPSTNMTSSSSTTNSTSSSSTTNSTSSSTSTNPTSSSTSTKPTSSSSSTKPTSSPSSSTKPTSSSSSTKPSSSSSSTKPSSSSSSTKPSSSSSSTKPSSSSSSTKPSSSSSSTKPSGSSSSTKPSSSSSSTKPSSSSYTTSSGTVSNSSSKFTENKSSEKAQKVQSPPQTKQSPSHTASPQITEAAQSKKVSPEPVKGVSTGSTNRSETKTVTTPKQASSEAEKGSSLSMNPMTGRLEYSSKQMSKHKETNERTPPNTKNIYISHSQSVKETNPLPTKTAAVVPPKPSPSNTSSKLNQKFKKREPLSLPTSLFGLVPDLGSKDIRITPQAESSALSKKTMQEELDSYYKLIAEEENPEDLVASEDQDSEPEVTSVPCKVETPPKKMKLESSAPPPIKKPAVQTPPKPTVPDVATEDVDDSDMACEVPDTPAAANYSMSGLGMVQSSYGYSPTYGAASRQPSGFSRGRILVDKDYTHKSAPSPAASATTTTTTYSMEELEALTTCDSD